MAGAPSKPSSILVDLPSYRWNHPTSYWHETRQSRNHRFPAFARHDLIGSRLDSYNPLEPVWRNHLRVAELPWLRDHRIHGDIVFPAAGMICAAVEAARQTASEGSGTTAAADDDDEVSGLEMQAYRRRWAEKTSAANAG